MHKKIYIAACLLIFFFNAYSQSKEEIGLPQLKNYTPKQFEASSQNWSIVQDKRGIMYFGNLGVLEYDGINWRLTSLPNKNTVRSLGCSDSGRIYVGGVGDLGYLETDSKGKFIFISLLKYIPPESRMFADVWSLFISGSDVFFETDEYIFKWSEVNKTVKVWKSGNKFHVGKLVNGTFYVREWDKGLLKIDGDSLVLISGGEQFANERIYAMLPMPDSKNILIVTRTKGLFLFDGKEFKKFKTEADEYIAQNLIYMPGAVLSDGNIALGTLTGGLVIIDPKGRIVNIFNTQSGLIGNTIYYVYQDKTGAIWLALDGGITRLDYGSPASFFDARNGLDQSPYKLLRHKGILYAVTNSGIYYLNPVTYKFIRINNSPVTQCFDLLSFGDQLLAGTNEGVFKIENFKAIPIRKSINKDYEVSNFLRSKINTNRIFVATYGLGSLLFKNGKWTDEGLVSGQLGQLTTLLENPDGEILGSNTVDGISSINFPKDKNGDIIFDKAVIKNYNEKQGLPKGGTNLARIQNKNYFFTSNGIYRFNKDKLIFYHDSTFEVAPAPNGYLGGYYLFEDSSKRIWAFGGLEPVLGYLQKDGSYKWLKDPFKRFSDELLNSVYPDGNDVVWFASNYGAIRYNLKVGMKNHERYSSFIRSVSIGGDSVIYFGESDHSPKPEISYSNNSIKFEFSAPTFLDEERNQFKTFLEGFDEKWSGLSKEHVKEYTNLPAGKFVFRVKGINASQIESAEAVLPFVILSPWYKTWWAYAGYFLIFIMAFVSMDRYQRRRLTLKERQKARLRETELRVQAAEAKSKALQAENDRKKNVELLSEIGKEITATLDLDTIFHRLYEHVNELADATIFGVGIYHPEKSKIDYRLALENGKRYPPYSRDTRDTNQFPVWCILNRKPVFINDVSIEYKNYIQYYKEIKSTLEDGTVSQEPLSLIYLPLISQDRVLGVITIQSYKKDTYTNYHLNVLQNLASYTAIAIDNADAYRKLNETVEKLDAAINDLKSTQEKLIVQQKLASLGQLTAGIAHEIKNPLNFVNNFAQLTNELVKELVDEFEKKKNNLDPLFVDNINSILKDINQNVTKINEHGRRADSIVKSMLQHSRGKSGEKISTDINAILEEDLNLAYHGMRAQNSEFNVSIEKNFEENIGKADIVQQELSRVFLNIIQNSFYETQRKKMMDGKEYSPLICVKTKDKGDFIEVRIKDNGCGVPSEIRDKLFDPFFTTKPAGQGTGLGLSLSYDIIVKQHAGEIKFETETGEFTEFIITLPKKSI